MYEIVVGIDESEERAQAQVATITDMPLDFEDVHVTILHDFTDNPEGASVAQVGSVRHAKEAFEEKGVDVTLEESSGEPAAAIVEIADDRDADVIVTAGRKRTPTGKALFGSVTQDVILSTDRPVVVCSSDE